MILFQFWDTLITFEAGGGFACFVSNKHSIVLPGNIFLSWICYLLLRHVKQKQLLCCFYMVMEKQASRNTGYLLSLAASCPYLFLLREHVRKQDLFYSYSLTGDKVWHYPTLRHTEHCVKASGDNSSLVLRLWWTVPATCQVSSVGTNMGFLRHWG